MEQSTQTPLSDSETSALKEQSCEPQNPRYLHLSRMASILLHPFMVPLYMMLTLLYSPTIFGFYTPSVKLYLVGMTLLFTMLLPLVVLSILRRWGVLSSFSVSRRSERPIPLLAGAICYLLCAILLMRVPSFALLGKMMVGAACCEVFALLVTLRWKISLHLTAMGGAMGMLFMMSVAGAGELFYPILFATLFSGALASARLYLGCHNGMQIFAGFSSGFAIMTLVILF